MTTPLLGQELCPCNSGEAYQRCCWPFHSGLQAAPSALALMRSRYCAYALRDSAYVLATWHPDTRPQALDLSDRNLRWLGLEVLATVDGDNEAQHGEVSFCARYRQGLKRQELREKSRFVRLNERWYYVDGDDDVQS